MVLLRGHEDESKRLQTEFNQQFANGRYAYSGCTPPLVDDINVAGTLPMLWESQYLYDIPLKVRNQSRYVIITPTMNTTQIKQISKCIGKPNATTMHLTTYCHAAAMHKHLLVIVSPSDSAQDVIYKTWK